MDVHECDVCGGIIFKFLGMLGSFRWYRCRNCDANCYVDTLTGDVSWEEEGE